MRLRFRSIVVKKKDKEKKDKKKKDKRKSADRLRKVPKRGGKKIDGKEMEEQMIEQNTEKKVKQTEELKCDKERKITEDREENESRNGRTDDGEPAGSNTSENHEESQVTDISDGGEKLESPEENEKKEEVKPIVMAEDPIDPVKENESVIQKKSGSELTGQSQRDIWEIHAFAKKNLASDIGECMKTMRDIQKQIRETYEFEPCRRLCELARNIQQGAYKSMDDVSEDLGYIMEMFGIISFDASQGECFDAKKHEQVKTHFTDARERKIKEQYSPGYEKDGEIMMKAQVSVQ